MKILIVDDSRAIQAIIRRSLQKEGFSDAEYRSASNGNEALSLIESWLPDLVITDWHMPGMTGLEMLQAIQQTLQHKVPIGFATTETVQERMNEAINNGAAFILHKPFSDRQLGDAVRQALTPKVTRKPESDTEREPSIQVQPVDRLEHYLGQMLHSQVTLQEEGLIDLDHQITPWTVAFYGIGDQSDVRGFCALDRPAMAIIGGRLANLPLADTLPHRPLPPVISKQIAQMLKFSSQLLFTGTKDHPARLLRVQELTQVTPKLREFLAKEHGRRAYRMRIEGYTSGLMILVAR